MSAAERCVRSVPVTASPYPARLHRHRLPSRNTPMLMKRGDLTPRGVGVSVSIKDSDRRRLPEVLLVRLPAHRTMLRAAGRLVGGVGREEDSVRAVLVLAAVRPADPEDRNAVLVAGDSRRWGHLASRPQSISLQI